MRVLLVNPPAYRDIRYIREGRCEQRLSSFQYVMVPISLPSIAALLREKDMEVKIIDCIAENINSEKLIEDVLRYNPQLIIINYSTATYYGDREITRLLKEASLAHLSAIGTHVTALPEETLKDTLLDSVIRGEPEMTTFFLAESINNKKSLEKVEGISYRLNNKIVQNQDRKFIENLDSLPFPARDLIKNEKYTMPFSNRPYTLLISSRGCPYQCIYCTARQYYGTKLRVRSAPNIVDELVEILEKYNIKDVTMWSDTFTLSENFVASICNEILQRGIEINWMCNSRVDKVNLELLKLMKKAGCSVLSFGVESGVQKILDNAKKGAHLKQAIDAFQWTKESKIETIAHIMFGLPGETEETIKETIKFVRKLKPDYIQFYGAIPFPGTEFYKMTIENKWLVSKNWDMFEINQSIINTPDLSADRLRKMRRKAFFLFYFNPLYILKNLKKIKSLKDLFIIMKQGFSFIKEWVIKK